MNTEFLEKFQFEVEPEEETQNHRGASQEIEEDLHEEIDRTIDEGTQITC